MSCEECARIVVDEARQVLERLERIGALPAARRRRIAFGVAVLSVSRNLTLDQRLFLMSLVESGEVLEGSTESETIINALNYCHRRRPRIVV